MSLQTDTVVTREAAWLATTNDSLPVLVKTDLQDSTAPFDLIQAYWPSPVESLRAVYVTRLPGFSVLPFDTGFSVSRHTIRLKVRWPILADLQVEQQAFDTALDALVERVAAPLGDKTHGLRFMSAGQMGQGGITVAIADPERAETSLRADVTYVIDDQLPNI